jgi:peptide/nickel transport system permease protein
MKGVGRASLKTRTAIEAAKARAVRPWHLWWWHSLPNGIAPLLATSTLSAGTSRIVGVSSRFLGLGTQLSMASGSGDVQARFTILEVNPGVCLVLGSALVLRKLSLHVLGDRWREALGPRLQEEDRASGRRRQTTGSGRKLG